MAFKAPTDNACTSSEDIATNWSIDGATGEGARGGTGGGFGADVGIDGRGRDAAGGLGG